ncbi:MAG: metallophosphoesterase family protein [Anaerolineae bacterium]
MAKILHFADLHLDTSFLSIATSGRVAHRPRQALRECLGRIVDLALERQVDLVTIAGDLYEHGRRSADTGNFIRDELARLHPIPVLIAPGNHDPFTPESLYRTQSWPSNVAIADTADLQPFPINGDVEIWTAAFTAGQRAESPLPGFTLPAPGGGKRLLLLHASIFEDDTRHCPVAPGQVRAAGFDGALLGHIHNCQYSRPDERVYYPGSPEPLNFGEEGDHSVMLVDTDGDGLAVERVPVNSMRYATLHLDITEMDTIEQVRSEIVARARERDLLDAITRVSLEGHQHPDINLDVESLASSLAQCFTFFVDLVDETHPPYDFQMEAQGFNTRARFVKALLDQMNRAADPKERELLEEALVLGLRAFEGLPLAPRQRTMTGGAE